ncbi:MAG: PRC-barrel domain containing protein [Oligoflexia bacterium]|nr:PRC-barrel domain containing protein [Oligoflexia bacterium]MBF0364981.1 PRC-barrel domain containing protein [Oligoflexia bacterium]
MLSESKTITGYKLHAQDGDIGKVKEFYFDDHHWTIRYLVAETGNWLSGRQVLISPYALIGLNKKEQFISIDLTKKQIEESPSLSSSTPISQQFEEAYYKYFGWPMYYYGPHMWGSNSHIIRDREKWRTFTEEKKAWDHHLRSTSEVSGYYTQATDGEIGHIEDFVIEGENWAIRYLIIDTHNWWPGKKVLISPQWIKNISWRESKVYINLSRESIKQSPEYTEASLLTREYEAGLYKHYNHSGYWDKEAPGKEHSL